MQCRRDLGFTLLELLTAIVVLGFVIAMLSQGLRFGVWASTRAESEHWQDLLAADQALRHVIELADPGTYPEPAGLRGDARTLSLLTELPGTGGPARRADVRLVVFGNKLVLRWRPHLHAQLFGPELAWSDDVIVDGVAGATFAYFPRTGSAGWSSSWTADTLPGFVRITLDITAKTNRHWPPIIVATLREPSEE